MCKNCKHAHWKLTEKGNPKRKEYGQCDVEITAPTLPYSYSRVVFTKNPIWFDRGDGCPFFEPK